MTSNTAKSLKVKNVVEAGSSDVNHDKALARNFVKAVGLKVKTGVKGGLRVCTGTNANEKLVREAVRGKSAKVNTGVKGR
jgi:hypothetical protein